MESNSVLETLNVSRETIDSFGDYVKILDKWNKKINLVSKNSMNDVWERHISDSAQLWGFISNNVKKWVDLGSGAGFPGLIIAALAKEKLPDLKVTLIEADHRKCVFLNQAASLLKVEVEILTLRIQDCPFQDADIISARALAPMKTLISYFLSHGKIKKSKGLFLKGKNINQELLEVPNLDIFKVKVVPSFLPGSGCVVAIEKKEFV